MLQMHAMRPEELDAVKELWALSFGDDGAFVDRFLELCPPERFQVLLEDGVVRSFLALVPATLVFPDAAPLKADYVYALCTHPDCRGRGLGGQILNYADYFSRTHWAEAICTVPAEEGLHAFFRRWGYREGFTTWVTTLPAAALPAPRGDLIPLEPGEYGRRREKLLSGLPHLAYPEAALAFQAALGPLYALEMDGMTGLAAVETAGERVIMKELLLPGKLAAEGAALVAAAHPASEYELRTPWLTGLVGEDRREFGMWKPLDGKPRPTLAGGGGYLGLAFD